MCYAHYIDIGARINQNYMKTLKEISKLSPSSYTICDNQVNKGNLKSWSDRIEIYVHSDRKAKIVSRLAAYKHGLAERP